MGHGTDCTPTTVYTYPQDSQGSQVWPVPQYSTVHARPACGTVFNHVMPVCCVHVVLQGRLSDVSALPFDDWHRGDPPGAHEHATVGRCRHHTVPGMQLV